MQLLVTVQKPTTVVDVVVGYFCSSAYQSAVLATVSEIILLDSNFNAVSVPIPTSQAVTGLGTLREGALDALLVCTSNNGLRIVRFKDSGMSIDDGAVLHSPAKLHATENIQYLASSQDGSAAIFHYTASQVLVVRADAGRGVQEDVFGGSWGRIIDACFLGDDTVCLLENDPATSPSVAFYGLTPRGLVPRSKVACIDLDADDILRVVPWKNKVLVYGHDSIQSFSPDSEDGSETLAQMPAAYIFQNGERLWIESKSGTFFTLREANGTLTKQFELVKSSPHVASLGDLALAWGSGCPTQLIDLVNGTLRESLNTLGPVTELKPYSDALRGAGLLVVTSSTTDPVLDERARIFSTVSCLEYHRAVTRITSVATSINPTRLLAFDDYLLLCTPEQSIPFKCMPDRLCEIDALGFFNLETETLAANASTQITRYSVQTSSKKIAYDPIIELAAISADGEVMVASQSRLNVYTAETLDQKLERQFDGTIESIAYIPELCIATSQGLYIDDILHKQILNVTDIVKFGVWTAIGMRDGTVIFLDQQFKPHKEVQSLWGPVLFTKHGDTLLATADAVVQFSEDLTEQRLHFMGQKVDMLASLNSQLLVAPGKDSLAIYQLDEGAIASPTILGSFNYLGGVVREQHTGNIVLATARNGQTFIEKYDPEMNLLKSVDLNTKFLQQDIQVLPIDHDEFHGYLVCLGTDPTEKVGCQLAVVNFEATPSHKLVQTGVCEPMYLAYDEQNQQFIFIHGMLSGRILVTKDGVDIRYNDEQLDEVYHYIDISGDRALMLPYFENARVYKVGPNGNLIKDSELAYTEEAYAGAVLTSIKQSQDHDYVLSTGNALKCFEADEVAVPNVKLLRDPIITILRPPKSPALSDGQDSLVHLRALMGSENGGVYALVDVSPHIETSLEKVWEEAFKERSLLFSDPSNIPQLVDWSVFTGMGSELLMHLAASAEDFEIIEDLKGAITKLFV